MCAIDHIIWKVHCTPHESLMSEHKYTVNTDQEYYDIYQIYEICTCTCTWLYVHLKLHVSPCTCHAEVLGDWLWLWLWSMWPWCRSSGCGCGWGFNLRQYVILKEKSSFNFVLEQYSCSVPPVIHVHVIKEVKAQVQEGFISLLS